VTDEPKAVLVSTEDALSAAVDRLARAGRIALDIESNGLFKYKATLCTMQLAVADGAEPGEVVIVDTIGVPLAPLAELLGPGGPQKIVHDVSFDARILAEGGILLGNVLDTSLAARMLGRQATGLASLLGSELGIPMDKRLQHHDWTERPLRASELRYLVTDVIHLAALTDKLWAEVELRDIAEEIEEETRYRLAQAVVAASAVDPRPPYVRMKGVERLPREQLPILRRLADLRERKAKALDVPPYKVLGPDVLLAIAHARPQTIQELEKIKGATGGRRARSLIPALLEAVRAGLEDETVPDAELAMLERPHVPPSITRARRAREARLSSWRKGEAKRRGVDEQVVLPGHCLQSLADLGDGASLDSVAAVPGIGVFRVARDGAALVAVLANTASPNTEPAAPGSQARARAEEPAEDA
jgi:ribonuclease D